MKTIMTGLVAPPDAPTVPLSEPTIQQALRRIGATHLPVQRGKRNVLKWFVDLAQTDLNDITPAATQAKLEEFAALERHMGLGARYSPPLAGRGDLRHLREETDKYLTELVDSGIVRLGPFSMWIYIAIPKKLGRTVPEGHPGSDSLDTQAIGTHGLLREMAVLLKEYATSVVRCPRCKEMFVKPRKNADYCTRNCQNAHYMQTVRDSQPKRSAATRPPKCSAKAKKGGRNHGKKRR